VQSDEKDLCEQSKWPQAKEPTIAIYVAKPTNYCDATHKADSADYIKVSGYIQKYYCDNTPSGRFEIENNYSPLLENTNIRVGQLYKFKFENDKDNLVFSCKFKAYFIDTNTFESSDAGTIFYYNDIKFNANTLEYYVLYTTPSLTWHKTL
jgi:hypothetical protein